MRSHDDSKPSRNGGARRPSIESGSHALRSKGLSVGIGLEDLVGDLDARSPPGSGMVASIARRLDRSLSGDSVRGEAVQQPITARATQIILTAALARVRAIPRPCLLGV